MSQLVSARSSTGRRTRALAALERLLALVCVPEDTQINMDGFMRLQDTFERNGAYSHTPRVNGYLHVQYVSVSARMLPWISISTTKLVSLVAKGSVEREHAGAS